jgi:hypothetical protein
VALPVGVGVPTENAKLATAPSPSSATASTLKYPAVSGVVYVVEAFPLASVLTVTLGCPAGGTNRTFTPATLPPRLAPESTTFNSTLVRGGTTNALSPSISSTWPARFAATSRIKRRIKTPVR